MSVAIVEQPAQPHKCVALIDARAVEQGLAEATRADGAGLVIGIAQRPNQRRSSLFGAQPGERIQRAPTRRRICRVGKAYQLRNRRARAEPPAFQQGGVHHGTGRRGRARREDISQSLRAVVAADLCDGGYGLDRGRARLGRSRRANRLHQRGQRAGILQ